VTDPTREPWEADHDLPPEEARARLGSAFPGLRAGDVRYLAEGWDFRVFEVDGWAFRFPKRAECEQALAAEAALLARIADALPVPVPRYEFLAKGIGGYRKLTGQPASRARAGWAADFAAFLTALHGLPVGGLKLPVRGAETSPAGLSERLARSLGRVERALEPGVLAACRAVVEALAPPPSPGPPVVTHDDLYPEHLLVSADGDAVTGVLDWGDAALGDPAIDFFVAGFCGGDRFLESVVRRYGREADAGLLARARHGARFMAAIHIVDGVRMKRPDYVDDGIASLERLGLLRSHG